MFRRYHPPIRNCKGRAGFSLTELAITLCLAFLVSGAVWVAASYVYSTNKVRMGVNELVAIVNNIRTVYAEQGGMVGSGVALVTSLDVLKVFPLEMRQDSGTPAGIVFNPWNPIVNGGMGSVSVSPINCDGSNPATPMTPTACFSVEFQGVPQDACISLIAQTSTSPSGLYQVIINNDSPALPIVPSVAADSCNNEGTTIANTNDMTWIYILKGTSS